MISEGLLYDVRRTEETKGGILLVISAMRASGITPGPLGISETMLNAEAPWLIAVQASPRLQIQQIFTRGVSPILEPFTRLSSLGLNVSRM